MKKLPYFLVLFLFFIQGHIIAQKEIIKWPLHRKEMNPWTRWWWMGSAVDEMNLNELLKTYAKAGFGGVEITPIYGAIGFEKKYINYLSPKWMEMLNYTVAKATQLGMGVDMNNGTGWPFGGPQVKLQDAASKLFIQTYQIVNGKSFNEKIIIKDEKQLPGAQLQALTAYSDKGEVISLLDKVNKNGQLNWSPTSGNWELFAAFSGKTFQMVKRAAPGGEGLVLDHFDKNAVNNYLKKFDEVFHGITPGIRGFFNDSYEVYNANWTPNFFNEFKRRRGYDLSLYLRQLYGNDSSENVTRIKCDYRETISDMLIDNFALTWTGWAHKNGRMTKYQAHGSPGNLLDLYATSDIPECEAYFGLSYFDIPGLRHDSSDVLNVNSNSNIFKFASSAAHNLGKPLTSSETFVWLTDHFKTSFSQCKPEVEKLFLGGINHVFYHGTTYSPQNVPFPGWQFYASSNFSPSNSLWPHIKGLNNYITRCQSILQSGKPDNELLVYWPVYDCWTNPNGTNIQISMHNVNEWLTPTNFNESISKLQKTGYSLDYVSDKMLRNSIVKNNGIQIGKSGQNHKILIIPMCKQMPVETLDKIIKLVFEGATVIFESLPGDVPGLKQLEIRRNAFKNILSELKFDSLNEVTMQFKTGKGKVLLTANLEKTLELMGIYRETLTDAGIKFIRRDLKNGKYYYLVNHTSKTINEFIPLNIKARSISIFDPQSGIIGAARMKIMNDKTELLVQMDPGEALILRSYAYDLPKMDKWKYLEKYQKPIILSGIWNLEFTKGGPELPSKQKLSELLSWTQLQDPRGTTFSGSGIYSTNFNLPVKSAGEYLLDLGKVNESAHVWINGNDVGIIWSIPFRTRISKYLKKGINNIRIEVVNLMANRIRDMDIKGIKWRNYHEINFVNNNYKSFDASKWKPEISGLLGPVTIIPVL